MKNPILIQGAMGIETEYLIENLENRERKIINNYEFYTGCIKNTPVVISITKVATINAAISTFIGINEFEPKYVINQGVAGGHMPNVHIRDIVIGISASNMNAYKTREHHAGEGIHPKEWILIDWNEKEDREKHKIYCDRNLANKAKEFFKVNHNVHVGNIASGDCWNNEVDRINWFVDEIESVCEDMETYAVYKICEDNNIPMIGIRMISNNIVNGEEYDRNLAINLQKDIVKFIESESDLK